MPEGRLGVGRGHGWGDQASFLGIATVLERGYSLRSDQSLFPMTMRREKDSCMLTINNQSLHIRSIANVITVRFDFKDMERIIVEAE